MATEQRLIDANKVAQDVRANNKANFFQVDWSSKRVCELLENAPTVDAMEVVRCRNCQYAKPYERVDGLTGYYCQHPKHTFQYGTNWERIFEPIKVASDFCSHGERRTDHA